MIATALAAQPPEVVRRVRTFKTSAFDIALGNNSVDCVFCIRLLHHFQSSEHRLAALREFHRVTRDIVIVSLRPAASHQPVFDQHMSLHLVDAGKVLDLATHLGQPLHGRRLHVNHHVGLATDT